jgi:hypothetical protein
MNGSGTTMLADCLSRHNDLYVFPLETRVLPHFLNTLKSYGDLSKLPCRRALADQLGRCRAYWQTNGKKPVVLHDAQLSEPGFIGVVNALYFYFSNQCGKSRWADKTPMYVQHMTALKNRIPDARFLHIYRDGRDAAQSFHRRWRRSPSHTIYRWKRIIQLARAQGEALGSHHYMEIKYESLTENPYHYMKSICAFLDLSFSPNILQSSMPYFQSSEIESTSGTILSNSGKWSTYFSTREITELELIAGKVLAELDYEIISDPGDVNPSRNQLYRWKLLDRFWNTVLMYRYGGIAVTGMFLRRAKESLMQDHTNTY